ncbi:hypothetical protein [Desulfovibrio ferrophilus]|uniref:Uncharacterized protein n=1 Tax=Desulfovibrio ferrophilus TaxID=241368 RepID=A0A2Z6AZS2_9BACT|nr:hypothetical protein [Desulfovibrio ferrophilus]BBD08734.1 putative uncharacterized protein [Desulfovibrio ferrophilus]
MKFSGEERAFLINAARVAADVVERGVASFRNMTLRAELGVPSWVPLSRGAKSALPYELPSEAWCWGAESNFPVVQMGGKSEISCWEDHIHGAFRVVEWVIRRNRMEESSVDWMLSELRSAGLIEGEVTLDVWRQDPFNLPNALIRDLSEKFMVRFEGTVMRDVKYPASMYRITEDDIDCFEGLDPYDWVEWVVKWSDEGEWLY